MKVFRFAVQLAVSCFMAALLFASEASAQMYRPEPLEPVPTERLQAPGLSSSGIHALDGQFDQDRDLFAFQIFGGGRRLDNLNHSHPIDRPGPWVLYGRVYLLNFQNQLSEEPGISIGFKRTGPSIAGRIYIGIRKRF